MTGRAMRPAVRSAMFACALLAAWSLCPAADLDPGELIFEKNSLYHRIFVFQRGSVYILRFGTGPRIAYQSAVDIARPRRHLLEYTRLCFAGLLYRPNPKRAMVMGLGGGVIPRELRRYFPDLEIDVVEIDPEIPKVAEEFFGFRSDDRMQVHISDGRMFVKRLLRRESPPKYDLIVLDAFNSEYIPFHLMTREFLEEVKGVLADDGVVVANVFYTNRLFHAEMKTFLAVFGRCQAFLGARSTNAILVSPGPEGRTLTGPEALARATLLQQRHGFSFDLRSVARRLRPLLRPAADSQVLTDDRAPVNWLKEQPAEPLQPVPESGR